MRNLVRFFQRVLARTVAPAALVAVGVLASSCSVVSMIAVEVSPDGSGTIRLTTELDAEAIDEIGGSDRLVLDDVVGSAWTTETTEGPDGSVTLEGEALFANAEQAQRRLNEIAGPELAPEVAIERSQDFGVDNYRAVVSLDLSGGVEALADSDLQELLGETLVADTESLDPGSVIFGLSATVPGADRAVVEGPLGSEDPLEVEVSGVIERPEPGQELARATEEREAAESRRSNATILAIAGAVLLVLACLGGLRRLAVARSSSPSESREQGLDPG